LCAPQRNSMFSSVPGPFGSTWWNSSSPPSPQRRPSGLVNAQRAPSRAQTSRRTSAGIWRETVARPAAGRAIRSGRRKCFSDSLPNFRFSNSATKTDSARSMIAAGSPFGI